MDRVHEILLSASGITGIWEKMTSLSGKTYVIIIGVLIVVALAAIILAFCKKGRVRRKDINVLMLRGEDGSKVDVNIFKKKFAAVLVSTPDNAEEIALDNANEDLITELKDNGIDDLLSDEVADYITEENANEEKATLDTIEDSSLEEFEALNNIEDVSLANEQEPYEVLEMATLDNISDLFVEDIVIGDNTKENPIEPKPTSFFDEIMALYESDGEVPFTQQADDAEAAAIEETPEDLEDAPTEERVAAAELEEEEAETVVEEIDEIAEEPLQEYQINESQEVMQTTQEPMQSECAAAAVYEYSDRNSAYEMANYAAYMYANSAQEPIAEEHETVEEYQANETREFEYEDELLSVPNEPCKYFIEGSEFGEGDRVELVNYIRADSTCTSSTELYDSVAEELSIEQDFAPIDDARDGVEIVTYIRTYEEEAEAYSNIDDNAIIEETEEVIASEKADDIAESEAFEEVSTDYVDNYAEISADSQIYEQNAEENTDTVAAEAVEESIAGPIVMDDELSYVLVNLDKAEPEAIAASEQGALIVDANGDGVAEEILVDSNILKTRYKTVDMETRMRRADESVKGYYSEIKNLLLSYSGVKSRVSKKFDTFTIGRFIVAKMALRGNVINLYLALASESLEGKYFAEDVGNSETYGKTPTLHKVKSKRGCRYGIELITEIMTELQMAKDDNYVNTDYVALYPPENIEENKNEIRHLFKQQISVEESAVLSDEEAMEFLEITKSKDYTINKFMPINKYVVFVDDIATLYASGDTVTIRDLIAKEALPSEDNIFLEVRARGVLDCRLIVEAHSFDPVAVKMITLTDGKAIQYK